MINQDDDDLFEDDFDFDDIEEDFDDDFDEEDLDDADLGDESWNEYDDAETSGEAASEGVETIPEETPVAEQETASEDVDSPSEDLQDDAFGDEDEDFADAPVAGSALKKYFYPIVGGVVVVAGGLIYMATAPSSEPQPVGFPPMGMEDVAQDSVEPMDPLAPPEDSGVMGNDRQQVSLSALLEAESGDVQAQFGQTQLDASSSQGLTPMPETSQSGQDNLADLFGNQDEVADSTPVEDNQSKAIENGVEDEGVGETIEQFADMRSVEDGETVTADAVVETPVESVLAKPKTMEALSEDELQALLKPLTKETESLKKELQDTLSGLENKDRNIERGLTNVERELTRKIEDTDKKIERVLSSLEALEKKLEAAPKAPAVRAVEKVKAAPKVQRLQTQKQKSKNPVFKTTSKNPKWFLRSAQPGSAILGDRNSPNSISVKIGDRVQGLGRVTSIAIINGKWVVSGSESSVSQ